MRVASITEQLEHDVQSAVIRYYETFGCEVARFSEGRRSRITPGWPDLAVGCVRKRAFWVHETKRTHGGIQSSAQSSTQQWLEACGVRYILGGVPAAHAHLVSLGLIR